MLYFKDDEFLCKCGKCGLGISSMNPKLLIMLDALRLLFGNKLILNSAIRCADYNRTVPWAMPNSLHLTGCAVDVQAYSSDFKKLLVEKAFNLDFNGIGIGDNYVHLDIGEREALWKY